MTTSTSTTADLIPPPEQAPDQPGARPAAAAKPLSPPDAQRAALRDLLVLAAESATTEARLERELQAALQSAAEQLEKSTASLKLRSDTLTDKEVRRHAAALQVIEQKYAVALKAIREFEGPARVQAETELDLAEQAMVRKIEESTWLADSDLEVTLNSLAADERKVREEVAGNFGRVDALEREAVARSVTFGYRPTEQDLAAAKAEAAPPAASSAATADEATAAPSGETSANDAAGNEPTAGGSNDPAAGAAAQNEANVFALKAGGESGDEPTADPRAVPFPATLGGRTKPTDPDPAGTFAARQQDAVGAFDRLRGLGLPRLFVGVTPWLVVFMLCVLAAGAAWAATGIAEPNIPAIAGAAVAVLILAIVVGVALRRRARAQVQRAFADVAAALAVARQAARNQLAVADEARNKARARAAHRRDTEVRFAREKYLPAGDNARNKYEATIDAIDARASTELAEADSTHTAALTEESDRHDRTMAELEAQATLDAQAARLHHDRVVGDARGRYEQERGVLTNRLRTGLATIRAPIQETAKAGSQAPHDWDAPAWATWKPPAAFAAAVRFGRLHVDLMSKARASAGGAEVRLPLPPPFDLPATLAFPSRASLLVTADRDGRADAIRAVQMAMSRLLVSLPPGRVRFTLIDPVGLGQNFAGFMHLADHDDQLVGGRIWTETDQIDQRLADLTGHMETIIQKYLRNEFETIDDYNAQAGELAEPYRFLVVGDFPAGFTDEALRRLSSVASTGAKCGVYTLVFHDTRLPFPHGVTTLEDLSAHSVVLEMRNAERGMRNEGQENGPPPSDSAFRIPHSALWKDPVFEQFPLALDPPPSEDRLTQLCDVVGRGAKDAARVEVPFETIAPPASRFWTGDSGGDLSVPVGRTGATRLQHLRLGKGVAQHALIAGKTGSGKSTLLHALITNLALWYSPEQVEFYLIDFKKGVEFKTYATHALPHARAIAVESDREFGLSVLQRLDAELTRRGELFRAAGVQDLAAYRRSPSPQVMPRTLLIIDEFQEYFSEDDKLAQDASVLLDRLVRQGRAFGIHCLLGSQTIAGASGLPRSTIGQMAVRVALQTSDADSQLILGDNNSAARLLSRPGEAIYNDQGGLVEGNSPFQVAWLSDEQKDRYLARVRERADTIGLRMPDPIVFEGNAPADLSKNRQLATLLDATNGDGVTSGPPRAWVGDPVAIKDPTSVPMRRQSGANVLVIGQAEDAATATMAAMLISLAAQVPAGKRSGGVAESRGGGVEDQEPTDPHRHTATPPLPPSAPRFYILDATPADSSLYGTFARLTEALPHDVRLVEWRATPDAVNEIATELGRRRDEQDLAAPPVFLFVHGLQRYRILRKSDDDFSFSLGSGGGDEPKPADPGKQFAEILKDGPAHGVHVLAWADTAAAVDRTLDRGSLREFDNRVLFQMSANDSSNLIDSPAANKLGFHRGLAYSEEQGVMEKFRPYAVPAAAFLASVRERLGRR